MKKGLVWGLIIISITLLAIRFGIMPATSILSTKEKAGLKILTVPDKAAIYLDGQEMGTSPYENADLSPGEKRILIQKDDLKWEGKVKLIGGTWVIVNRQLSKDSTSASGEVLTLEKGQGVVVVSTPTQAQLEIDGQNAGITPIWSEVNSGEHTFTLSKDGFVSKTFRANLPDGFQLNILVDLSVAEQPRPSLDQPQIIQAAQIRILSTPTNFLRVRDKPSLFGQEIARVTPGDQYDLLEELPNWVKIRLKDGVEGYVSKTYVQKI